MKRSDKSPSAWIEVDDHIRAGQLTQAKRCGAKLLRDGCHDRGFLLLIADLLDPDLPRARGRPPGSPADDLWMEIGDEYLRLREPDVGMNYEDAVRALADTYRFGTRTIEEQIRRHREFWTEEAMYDPPKFRSRKPPIDL